MRCRKSLWPIRCADRRPGWSWCAAASAAAARPSISAKSTVTPGHGPARHRRDRPRHALGPDRDKAGLAAIFDALWQADATTAISSSRPCFCRSLTGIADAETPQGGRDRGNPRRFLHHGAGRQTDGLTHRSSDRRLCRAGLRCADASSSADGRAGPPRHDRRPLSPTSPRRHRWASAAGAIALTLCDHDTPVWLRQATDRSRRCRRGSASIPARR